VKDERDGKKDLAYSVSTEKGHHTIVVLIALAARKYMRIKAPRDHQRSRDASLARITNADRAPVRVPPSADAAVRCLKQDKMPGQRRIVTRRTQKSLQCGRTNFGHFWLNY